MSEKQTLVKQNEEILNAFVTQQSRFDFEEKSVVWRRVISKYKSKYSFI